MVFVLPAARLHNSVPLGYRHLTITALVHLHLNLHLVAVKDWRHLFLLDALNFPLSSSPNPIFCRRNSNQNTSNRAQNEGFAWVGVDVGCLDSMQGATSRDRSMGWSMSMDSMDNSSTMNEVAD
eukprot:Gb_36944 [translate_table: standard]